MYMTTNRFKPNRKKYLNRSTSTVADDDLVETIDAFSPLKRTMLGGHGYNCNQQSPEEDHRPQIISHIPHGESSSPSFDEIYWSFSIFLLHKLSMPKESY